MSKISLGILEETPNLNTIIITDPQWAEALVRARFRAPNMICFLKSKYERNGLKNQNIGLRNEKNALQSSKAPSFQQKDT